MGPLALRWAFCAVHVPAAVGGGVTYQTSGPPSQSTNAPRARSKSMPKNSLSASGPDPVTGTTKYERFVGPGGCRHQTTRPHPLDAFAVRAYSLRTGS